MSHGVAEHSAKLMALFVEEMALNILESVQKKHASTSVDFRWSWTAHAFATA